jgi:Tat protein secretion system quality control protein TatD with DNase activity
MEAVAGIKEVSEEEIAAVTTENAIKVFKFPA